ncbi:hypothetical protein QOZ80_8AG0631410 [Eleusine coracana subsp. coracana]|nr:hypothetical protein QOZ80_8AG0631410 [Eleusine coracana subsp. coracana]
MVAVGELLVSAVVKVAIDKLCSAMVKQASSVWNIRKNLEDMKNTLETLGAVLQDAEMRSIKEKEVRLWLKRLKAATYDISDMLDDFDASTEATGKMTGVFPVAIRKILQANKMKRMREKLWKIEAEHKSFSFMNIINPYVDQQPYDQRETSAYVNESDIIGRDAEKQVLMDLLRANHDKDGTMIVPIYGLGGTGKTTLAQLVYNDNQFKKYDKRIGFNIAKKCGGVPLAAQALGYMLRFKDLHEWTEINNSDIWNESSEDETVLPSLKLSYECMPPSLRMCFSYCATFPKGHEIVKDDLIHKWTALDFIDPSKGVEYIKQLLGMSFLQHSKLPVSSRKHVVRYAMHDLVHDLASSVIGDELVVLDAATKSIANELKYCHYLLLTNYNKSEKFSNILVKKVRAFHFLPISKLDLPPSIFSFAKCCRILDFNECSGILLPASIGQLKQLRCLTAPKVQNERLPKCITELSKLQYLNINGSSRISALPGSIGKLGALTYLSLSGCSGISKLPDSIGDLKCLVDLNLSDCSGIVKLPESFGDLKKLLHLDMSCSGITELPGTFGNLTNLNRLELSQCFDLRALPESLCGLNTLQYLNLTFCSHLGRLPEAIGSLVNLQYMNMSRCRRIKELPGSFQNLKNLEHLDLLHCCCVKGLPGALHGLTALQHLDMSFLSSRYLNTDDLLCNGDISDALGSLTNLKNLSLSSSMNECFGYLIEQCDTYVDFIGTLTNLEQLNLSYNRMLKYLPETICNLKKLHTLDVSYCTELKSLPNSIDASTIKSLLVDGCSDQLMDQVNSRFSNYSLTLPLFKVSVDDVSGCSNLHQLEDVDASELTIRCLENVRFLETAQRVKLVDKKNLFNLTFAWTSGAARLQEDKDLLEQLLPPSGLQGLDLEGYKSTSFPSWLMGISHHLPNISFIRLKDLPTCSNLPPLGQLPNLEILFLERLPWVRVIDRNFCGGKGAFSRLSVLSMEKMEGLEEWNTTYYAEDGVEEYMFPVLDDLQVMDCPRLRLRPCPPTFRQWIIKKSDQVITSLEDIQNISHISSAKSTNLIVRESDCQSLRLFHHFPMLQNIEISKCPNLTSLPESMRHLMSLQSLELNVCESVSAVPDWICDLSSLRSIVVKGCNNLNFLPSCIQRLNRLQKLRLDCTLKQWYESDENKTWRTHIKDKIYLDWD